MGMRQPAHIPSQLGYGLPETLVESARPKAPSPIIPLLLLVAGLAGAMAWYVALPAFATPQRVERSCEVYVLKTGATKCVPLRTGVAKKTQHRPRPQHVKR
jgi:hypothetical protein